MRKSGAAGVVFGVIAVVFLSIALAATYYITENYVVLNWQLYPKHQEQLDLRSRAISAEEYDVLSWRMPGTDISWSIPFRGDYLPSNATELTITSLSEEDVAILGYFPELKTIHAEQCTDYGPLALLYETYPELEVLYTVPVGGGEYPPDTETVYLTSLTAQDMDLLQYLPRLTTVDGTGCREFILLRELERDHPEWTVTYLTAIAGTEFAPNTRVLEVTGADYGELSVGLSAMPDLHTITIHSPAASGEELATLRREYPDVEICWDVEIFGTTYEDDCTELDISGFPIDSIDTARELASKFPNLEKLIVDSGNISNEDMAAYRDEVRDSYRVVWTVVFTANCSSRTDAEYFMPTKQGEYYFKEENVHDLMYLEDVVAVDLGHHPIHTIEFVRYMPHLKYLILTFTEVRDLTPLETCKELIFLEIDWTYIKNLEPLVGCTALEDLSICSAQCAPEVVIQLQWLKHLIWREGKTSSVYRCAEEMPDTMVTSTLYFSDGTAWRTLQNYYDMRDILGMPYMSPA